jgi:hypothetical protein
MLVLTGNWSYCSLEDFYGTASNYVVVINQGGQVHFTNGLSFTNCRYLKLLGTRTKDKYGFRVSEANNDGVGVYITGRSSYIEVSNVDIYNKTYGYWVKQEASCIDSLQFPNWTINHITIHDGRVKLANQEGMYLGSTDPNGTRAISCNGSGIYIASIMIDTRNTSPAYSTTFNIANNTLGANTDVNIRVYKTYPTYTKENIICKNRKITMGIVSGITWTTCH